MRSLGHILKGRSDRFRYPQGVKLDQANDRVFLPKLGWLRYRNSREVLGTVKNVTASLSGGKWFISIQTERHVAEPVHPASSIVGIDMGIIRFATLSDGTFVAPLNGFKRHQDRLRKAQQSMSRKQKFSHNGKKARARVQRIHTRIGATRRDFLHKTTTQISQNHAIVWIEDLQVRNMARSALSAKPHSTHANRACVLRLSALMWPQHGHVRLVYCGGTATSHPPLHASL